MKNLMGVLPLICAIFAGHVSSRIIYFNISIPENISTTLIDNEIAEIIVIRTKAYFETVRTEAITLAPIPPKIALSQDELNTKLIEAAEQGNLDDVKLYIERGADANAKSTDKSIRFTAQINDFVRAYKASAPKSLGQDDIVVKDTDGTTALMWASWKGNFEIVKYLIEHKSDVNGKGNTGITALIAASLKGHLEIINCLVEHGATVDTESLYLASAFGYLDVVKYLFKNGTNEHRRVHHALCSASLTGHLDIVKYLVQYASDIDLLEILQFAVHGGKLDVLKYLFENGANIHDFGPELIHDASGRGHLDVLKYFVSNGIDINVKDRKGKSPLDYALIEDKLKVTEWLKNNGGIAFKEQEKYNKMFVN